jgi:hypothetical protein
MGAPSKTYGYSVREWDRLAWGIQREFQNARTPEALEAAHRTARAWLDEPKCEESWLDRALRLQSTSAPMPASSHSSATVGAVAPKTRKATAAGTGGAASATKATEAESLTEAERVLLAAGWTRSKRQNYWRDPNSEDDYPEWRALQVARRDVSTDERGAA